jgi:hypothetical protein
MSQNECFVMFFAIKWRAHRGIVSVTKQKTVGTGELA